MNVTERIFNSTTVIVGLCVQVEEDDIKLTSEQNFGIPSGLVAFDSNYIGDINEQEWYVMTVGRELCLFCNIIRSTK